MHVLFEMSSKMVVAVVGSLEFSSGGTFFCGAQTKLRKLSS